MTRSEGDLTERQQAIQAQFEDERGYWADIWEEILRLDPEFLNRHRKLSAQPELRGTQPEGEGVHLHRRGLLDDAPVRSGQPDSHRKRLRPRRVSR